MPGWTWLFIVAVVAFDLLLVVVIVPMLVRGALGSVLKRYPPVEPADDTVWRRRQSISVDKVNLGLCVDLGADLDHLHIRANRFGRLLGVPAISVPWAEMDRPRLRWIGSSVRLGRTKLTLPRWAVELAMGEGDSPNDADTSP